MSLSENRSHFSGTCVKSGLCHDCRFRHQTGAAATALTHPAADEVCATDRVLGRLDGMGGIPAPQTTNRALPQCTHRRIDATFCTSVFVPGARLVWRWNFKSAVLEHDPEKWKPVFGK